MYKVPSIVIIKSFLFLNFTDVVSIAPHKTFHMKIKINHEINIDIFFKIPN